MATKILIPYHFVMSGLEAECKPVAIVSETPKKAFRSIHATHYIQRYCGIELPAGNKSGRGLVLEHCDATPETIFKDLELSTEEKFYETIFDAKELSEGIESIDVESTMDNLKRYKRRKRLGEKGFLGVLRKTINLGVLEILERDEEIYSHYPVPKERISEEEKLAAIKSFIDMDKEKKARKLGEFIAHAGEPLGSFAGLLDVYYSEYLWGHHSWEYDLIGATELFGPDKDIRDILKQRESAVRWIKEKRTTKAKHKIRR